MFVFNSQNVEWVGTVGGRFNSQYQLATEGATLQLFGRIVRQALF